MPTEPTEPTGPTKPTAPVDALAGENSTAGATAETPDSEDALGPVEPTSDAVGPERRGGALRALFAVVGLVVAALVLGTAVGLAVVVPLLFAFDLSIFSPTVLVISLLATQLSFVAVGAAYDRRQSRALGVSIRRPTRRDVGWAVGGTALSLAIAAGFFALAGRVGVEPVRSVIEDSLAVDPRLLLALAVLSAALVAPAEEYFFRGVVQGRLRGAVGAPAAIVLTSLLFASIHALNVSGGGVDVLVVVAIVFLVAVVLGVAYERTGNLAVPMSIHAAYNVTLFVATYLLFR